MVERADAASRRTSGSYWLSDTRIPFSGLKRAFTVPTDAQYTCQSAEPSAHRTQSLLSKAPTTALFSRSVLQRTTGRTADECIRSLSHAPQCRSCHEPRPKPRADKCQLIHARLQRAEPSAWLPRCGVYPGRAPLRSTPLCAYSVHQMAVVLGWLAAGWLVAGLPPWNKEGCRCRGT